MNETFEKRVRAAAVAAWWTTLAALGFVVAQWLLYLAAMANDPSWLLSVWGPGVDWPFVHNVWFWAVVGIKAFVWLLAAISLWLTLWARQLRKHGA